MSDSITTKLDVPYGQQPETRAAAVRVMQRLGAADLLDVLGLDERSPTPAKPVCETCQQPLAPQVRDGGCRRTAPCRTVSARRLRKAVEARAGESRG